MENKGLIVIYHLIKVPQICIGHQPVFADYIKWRSSCHFTFSFTRRKQASTLNEFHIKRPVLVCRTFRQWGSWFWCWFCSIWKRVTVCRLYQHFMCLEIPCLIVVITISCQPLPKLISFLTVSILLKELQDDSPMAELFLILLVLLFFSFSF